MITRRQQILAFSAVTVIGIAILYNHRKRRNEKRNQFLEQKEEIQYLNSYEDLNEKYRKSLEEMEREEDEKRNLRVERTMAMRKAKKEMESVEFRRMEEENQSIFNRMKLESEERIRKLKKQNRRDQLVKDRLSEFDDEQLKKQGEFQLEQIRMDLRRSREVNQRNSAQLDDLFYQKKIKLSRRITKERKKCS
uniref:Uncharacterized protein n=1 Tax=Caenorhabditis tropicalis TaxID=1561998 RepID=A0A1I7SZY3_9PELO